MSKLGDIYFSGFRVTTLSVNSVMFAYVLTVHIEIKP